MTLRKNRTASAPRLVCVAHPESDFLTTPATNARAASRVRRARARSRRPVEAAGSDFALLVVRELADARRAVEASDALTAAAALAIPGSRQRHEGHGRGDGRKS